ncbi:GDP-L-fucose synthase [Campylobacter sp. VicNov18]|uniref:GDP-L-fucose synthase family protein n=1 Tax=Campylobacter bilis TaxID=2691918 RepID=UPI00130E6F72|nr:GDP-L-fucose synthase [Campylobacter bilis]MPV64167.1 NAD-dependent epimerase/dehydratase family protein [Campylobacter hepaticus]MBM0637671.1 NAD-dependent epimerase/dehydratase family protein [Campylobacter bilis]MCC8278395.1 GDP-L-fucose synthase [Campylobacter bilis]MCC8299899.1 GDP-L-fucose synthase [Campylobacter bilis]MCC8301304.1 GDP-L-fucose synthase [Campylobacter bilis]
MLKDSKIYIAGHNGLVGSAMLDEFKRQGYNNLVFRTHEELDLTNQNDVAIFFEKEKPEYVFLSAAKVGGILANNTYRADFIYQNLMIECNVIHNAYLHKVKKLLFVASTTIYPKNALFPTNEKQMLAGDLEYTNKPYAIAKIAGLILCESYNLQYGTNFIAITPTNLYGNNDKFDLEKSHVLPAILRKMHLAKLLNEKRYEDLLSDLGLNSINEAKVYLKQHGINENSVEIWGNGEPTREFLHSQDLANACLFIMNNIDFKDLKDNNTEITNTHLNIGPNKNISIKDLANMIKNIVGFKGKIIFNVNRPNGVMHKLTDCSKLHSLGWKHKIELEEGIKMMYNWYLKNNK